VTDSPTFCGFATTHEGDDHHCVVTRQGFGLQRQTPMNDRRCWLASRRWCLDKVGIHKNWILKQFLSLHISIKVDMMGERDGQWQIVAVIGWGLAWWLKGD
jgi:hypothetical protein